MAIPRIGGQTGTLPLPNSGVNVVTQAFGAAPFAPVGFYNAFSNIVTLGAGECWVFPPGTWAIKTGPYTFLQWLDPVAASASLTAGVSGQTSPSGVVGLWRVKPTAAEKETIIDSDGSNYRLANTTGCVVGAVITTGGTAPYTNGIGQTATGCTVTISAGASKWVPVVGGAVSLTLSTSTGTTTAGTGYNFPPICVIDAPPVGGMQATAIVTSLSTGTIPVANVQIINQGAGYTTAPNVTFIPDSRELNASTPGPTANAVVVLTLTATGQLTGLYPYDSGSALTSVPTLTMTSGSVTAAATAIMNFTVTGQGAYTTGGSSLGSLELVSVSNTIAASTNYLTNPLHNGVQVTFPRPARIMATLSSGVASSTTGTTLEDAGLGIQQVPSMVPVYSITSTTAVVPQPGTPTVGGITDTSFVQML